MEYAQPQPIIKFLLEETHKVQLVKFKITEATTFTSIYAGSTIPIGAYRSDIKVAGPKRVSGHGMKVSRLSKYFII